MKIQIRKGAFETNSSSVHTIAVPKSTENFSAKGQSLYVPADGEFGWQFDTIDTPAEKASYLWQAIRCSVTFEDAGIDRLYDEDCNIIYENDLKLGEVVKEKVEKFKSLLEVEGVQYTLECPFL